MKFLFLQTFYELLSKVVFPIAGMSISKLTKMISIIFENSLIKYLNYGYVSRMVNYQGIAKTIWLILFILVINLLVFKIIFQLKT